ncbi:MAG: MBL fold metallo-hydrolase [Acidobacteria bacterium]|nr:MBL fold metallo-hydrolase [Acidobacteriota bacterium]
MSTENLYLKPNVLAEPLFNQWYAWPYLIAPATAAMCIANLHLKIMRSFVNAPQVHISALKNPAMLGGPFINYDASKVGAIRTLIDKTEKENARMIEFAQAVKTLDEMLASEAGGFSLEPLYPKVPEPLRGYVELVYDLNNHASIRFIEGLLYRSPYYSEAAQTISLSLVEKDDRPFVFSTPRLQNGDSLHLQIPFRHEGLDELFKMRHEPRPYGYIKDVLSVRDEDDELFSSFFTTSGGAPTANYDGDGIRIRYLGHASILIETKEVSLLFDPVISYDCETGEGRYTYRHLPPRLDYVLITHNHQDHCMFETLLQLRHKIGQVIVPKNNGGGLADPSMKFILQKIGFNNVTEIDEMETVSIPGGELTGLPFFGEHADLNIRTKLAYFVNLKGRKVMCAADSNNIEPKLYELINEQIGGVDVMFLGMECDGAPMTWLYGPLLTQPLARKMDQSRRFDGSNFEKGIDLVNRTAPKEVYVYAMGQEPWLTYLTSLQYTDESRPIVESNKLVGECRQRGLTSERLYCMKEMFLEAG